MNPPPGIEELANGQWVVAGDTHLSTWAKEHGTIITDPCLFEWLKPRIDHVFSAWDIGANIGDHARQYLDWGMQVVAMEPNPLAFECLQHNCPDAHCKQLAASDSAGVALMALSPNVGASRIAEGGSVQVITAALDDLRLPVPGFVKIDVEGYEPFAITGMAGTITRHKPILFIEMNRGALEANGASPEALHDTILSLGYSEFEFYPQGADFSWPQFDILYLK